MKNKKVKFNKYIRKVVEIRQERRKEEMRRNKTMTSHSFGCLTLIIYFLIYILLVELVKLFL